MYEVRQADKLPVIQERDYRISVLSRYFILDFIQVTCHLRLIFLICKCSDNSVSLRNITVRIKLDHISKHI